LKRLICIMSIATALLILLSINAFALSGNGTESNPFRITTAEELLLLADFPTCYFELENDIELTEKWMPIDKFSGNFDGKYHTITVKSYGTVQNDTFNGSVVNTGFFGTVSGTVKNLIIHANNLRITAVEDINGAGVIAGVCSGNIQSCKITGKIKYVASANNELSVGGICGKVTGNIDQCINAAAIELDPYENYGTKYINYGGIAYQLDAKASVTNCMNLEETLSSSNSYARYYGIAYSNYGSISNCYSVGGNISTISIKYGIADGTLENCYFDKTVMNYTDNSTTHGIPKSTLAMKMKATYQNWDFDTTWAIDESERNPINNGYPYLRCFYEKNNCPITISTITAVEGNLVVDTKITDTSDTYVLHIALYDANDKMCEYIIIPNDRKLKDVFTVFKDNQSAKYAKIFTWSATSSIEPIAVNEIIDIIR